MTQIGGVLSLVLKQDGSASILPRIRRLRCIGGMIFSLIFHKVYWLFRELSSSGTISQLFLFLSALLAYSTSLHFAFLTLIIPTLFSFFLLPEF